MGRGLRAGPTVTLAPSQRDREQVVAALRQLLETSSTKRQVVQKSLLAIARARDGSDVLPLLQKFLRSGDVKRAEYATLALGITGLDAAVPSLIHLARCDDEGHRMVKRAHVPYRVKSFACYALGRIAHRTKNAQVRKDIYATLELIAKAPKPYRRDLKVAALQAMRTLRADGDLSARALDFLHGYYRNKSEPAQIRAHALTAIADLAGSAEAGAEAMRMNEILADRRQSAWMHQSATLALGRLAVGTDADSALRGYLSSGKDLQARFFAAISLGRIGGPKNRAALLTKMISRRTPRLLKPWLALGLAIADANARDKDPSHDVDQTAADAIHAEFKRTRNGIYAAGLGIALGIMRYTDAGDDILDRMDQIKSQEAAAGYLAVALGLMGYSEARETLHTIMEHQTRKPRLVSQTAIALALLDDKEVSTHVLRSIASSESSTVLRSLSRTLGLVGDRRSLSQLLELLADKKLGAAQRALVAESLGLVADIDPLPWNTVFSVGTNYQAKVATLTHAAGGGVLDIQ